MSSSRVIATRKRSVFISHICSKCGFPLISVVQIEAEAQRTYTFSQEKASQIASDTAENAIEDEIHRIEACRSGRALVGNLQKESMISPGFFAALHLVVIKQNARFVVISNPGKVLLQAENP